MLCHASHPRTAGIISRFPTEELVLYLLASCALTAATAQKLAESQRLMPPMGIRSGLFRLLSLISGLSTTFEYRVARAPPAMNQAWEGSNLGTKKNYIQ
jgi:hypothetical protein